jgi:aerobic-type carbon monoxide dehydrogenase small subunit (CoxS/CutS family)
MSGFGDPPPDLDRPGFGTPAAGEDPPAPPPPPDSPAASARVSVHVNGDEHTAEVEPRTLLSDFLRHQLGLTGTKVGCEDGTCGSCTVQLDGEPVLACLTFAIQVDQAQITTIEGLEPGSLQRAFHEHHALQCGFCTAGILLTLDAYLKDHPEPTDTQLKAALAGNLCRCTGYAPIIEAVRNR